jgi:hypothetical protein
VFIVMLGNFASQWGGITTFSFWLSHLFGFLFVVSISVLILCKKNTYRWSWDTLISIKLVTQKAKPLSKGETSENNYKCLVTQPLKCPCTLSSIICLVWLKYQLL